MLPIVRRWDKQLEPLTHRFGWGDLNRLFNEFWPEEVAALGQFGNMDMYDEQDRLHIDVELPGCKNKDIEIHLENGMLHLQAKREHQQEKKERNYYLRERSAGTWSRTLQLPTGLDEQKIDATFNEGVLNITIEKQEQKKARKVEVK